MNQHEESCQEMHYNRYTEHLQHLRSIHRGEEKEKLTNTDRQEKRKQEKLILTNKREKLTT